MCKKKERLYKGVCYGKIFWNRRFPRRSECGLNCKSCISDWTLSGLVLWQKKQPDEKCRILIGKDTRLSSYMFEYALASGITASGADACLLHVTTTPSVAYVVRTEDFDGGVMISASHNPYYDNGIKLINAAGEKMDEETLLKVEAYMDGISGEIPFAYKEKSAALWTIPRDAANI